MRSKLTRSACIVFFVSALLFPTLAESSSADYRLTYQSARIFTLGGAFTCITDEENTPLYNPASLEYLDDSKLAIFGVRADLNGDSFSTFGDLGGAYIDYGNLSKIPQKTINQLSSYDPIISVQGPIEISYVRHRLGISLLNSATNAKLSYSHDGSQSTVRLKSIQDELFAIGYGRRVYRGLSLGLTLKYLVRSEIGKNGGHNVQELIDGNGDILIRRGLGWNAGLLYEIPRWDLKVGLLLSDPSGMNMSESKFSLDKSELKKQKTDIEVKRTMRIGVVYEPNFRFPYGRMVYYPYKTLVLLDFGDGDSFGSRIHLGAEMLIFRWLALRMGINSGFRIGFGLRSTIVKFDYAFATGVDDDFLNTRVENVHIFSLVFSY